MQVTFREYIPSDLNDCLTILKENHPDDYDDWETILLKDLTDISNKKYSSKFIIVLIRDEIIGFGCYFFQDTSYKITWVNIHSKEQNKGIGKKLVKELEKYIKRENPNNDFYITLETDKPYFYKKLKYQSHTNNGSNIIMQKYFPLK